MGRNLYLHEYIDIVGDGAFPYMAHTVAFDTAGAADRGLRLFGTWYVIGSTGRWPQVVNLWELEDGWEGWRRLLDSTNIRRAANRKLDEWWQEALRSRSGGFDRLLGAASGCPSLDELTAAGATGSLFVHELSTVPPGATAEYLRAVREEWAPVMAERGHRLVGLYEVLLGNTEVCTIWATDLDSHVRLGRAGDDGDGDVHGWRERQASLVHRWREELMVPAEGTALYAPPAGAPG